MKKSTRLIIGMMSTLFVAFMLFAWISSFSNQPVTKRTAVSPEEIAARKARQYAAAKKRMAAAQENATENSRLIVERKAFIEKLIRQGVFQKVEVPGSLPHLWVRPAFYALDFDDKQAFVSVVYAYYFQQKVGGIVVLFDSLTGKEIGKFTERGLNL